MKKTLCALLALALLAGGASALAEGRLSAVATIFPVYDWVRAVVGDADVDATLLLDNGVDLHSYQPTAQDIMRVASCDVFVYVGGESDAWVDDALKTAVNPDMIVVDLLDALGEGAREEELVEGMQGAPEASEGGDAEYDEHVWLSLRNARALTAAIAEALAEADPAGAETYRANAAAYGEKLDALDEAYVQAVAAAPVRTVLFGDRLPFRYLADDYGLGYYAAFSGCSAETEASFETIVFLSGKVDELGLPAVLTIEGPDHRVAETVAQSAKAAPEVLTLDSMQATTGRDVDAGASYRGIMESNLEVLKRALGA